MTVIGLIMPLKNRHVFVKRTYPNTVVLFDKNNKYTSYKLEREFLDYLHFSDLKDLNRLRINYIVISNMTIIKHISFEDNKYLLYYKRFKLIKLIEYIRQRRR